MQCFQKNELKNVLLHNGQTVTVNHSDNAVFSFHLVGKHLNQSSHVHVSGFFIKILQSNHTPF